MIFPFCITRAPFSIGSALTGKTFALISAVASFCAIALIAANNSIDKIVRSIILISDCY